MVTGNHRVGSASFSGVADSWEPEFHHVDGRHFGTSPQLDVNVGGRWHDSDVERSVSLAGHRCSVPMTGEA